MIIGILREIKPETYRVDMTPAGAVSDAFLLGVTPAGRTLRAESGSHDRV
jgi:hypothetical protein